MYSFKKKGRKTQRRPKRAVCGKRGVELTRVDQSPTPREEHEMDCSTAIRYFDSIGITFGLASSCIGTLTTKTPLS